MKNHSYLFVFVLCTIVCWSCQNRPSKVELLRQEKARQDSIEYVRHQQNIRYSDSLLQELIPQVEPAMKAFLYEKNESYEDKGHYVHRLLQTGSNTQRCFLQAYLSEDRELMVQSYYYGSRPIHQHSVRLTVGDVYVEASGTLHSFDAEGVHEVLSILGKDAYLLLQFVAANQSERIRVTEQGTDKAVYYLTDTEKQALAETYELAMLTQQINDLERSVRISQKMVEKRRKKGC